MERALRDLDLGIRQIERAGRSRNPRIGPFDDELPEPELPAVVTIPYYLSYDGILYRFRFTSLTQINTPVEFTSQNRTLRIHRGTFFWLGDDPDSGDHILFRSDGSTVTSCPRPAAFAILAHFSIASDGRIWAIWLLTSLDCAIYFSDDQGDSWTLSLSLANDNQFDLNMIACHRRDPNKIVASHFDGNTGAELLHGTNTRGSAWANHTLANDAGFASGSEPNYHLQFLGNTDDILFLFPSPLHKLVRVRTDATLASVDEDILINDSSPGQLTAWAGATIKPDDPDTVIFAGDDDAGGRWWWRSTDGGLTIPDKIAYIPRAPNWEGLPGGYLWLESHLYIAVSGGSETRFYKIANAKTSFDMAATLAFTASGGATTPEANSETFAVAVA